MDLKKLVGSGDRIGLVVLPFLVIGVILNRESPGAFTVGGPPFWLGALSLAVLIPGVTIWLWSVVLILINVPRGQLITRGPYALVKHPLYSAVALLVIPWMGFLFDTWLGVVIGAALYAGSRMFSPAEEAALSREFGPLWDDYTRTLKLGWL